MRFLLLSVAMLTANVACAQDNIILQNGEEIPAKVLEVNQTDLRYRKTANPDGPIYTSALRDVLLIKYANGTKDTFDQRPRNRPGNTPDGPRLMGSGPAPNSPAPGLNGLRYQRQMFSQYYLDGNGQRLEPGAAKSLLLAQPTAMEAFNRGRSLRTWSRVAGLTGVALLGTGIGLAIARGDDDDRDRDNGRMNRMGMTYPYDNDGHGGSRKYRAARAALVGSGLLLGAAALWLDCRATVQFKRAADRFNNRQPTTLRLAPAGQGVSAVLTF